MKKLSLAILCMFLFVQPVFAIYNVFSENKIEKTKVEAFNKKMEALTEDIGALAHKIAAFNKPIFEAQLTRKEREYQEWGEDTVSISKVVWNRVYAKDKTLVLAYGDKKKKFEAIILKTNDPSFSFSGLRVGASIKDLEHFFGDKISNIGHIKGNTTIVYGPYYGPSGELPSTISIICANGIVSELIYDIGFEIGRDGMLSEKAVNFAEKQTRKMKLSSINRALPTYFNDKTLVTILTDPNKN